MSDHGKATDNLLDYISVQRDTIRALEIELAMYRMIVPVMEVDSSDV